jgi:hypothetical protein
MTIRALKSPHAPRALRGLSTLALAATLGACAYMPQLQGWKDTHPGKNVKAAAAEALAPVRERPELLVAVTPSNQMLTFQANEPGKILSKKPLQGLLPTETLLAIDYQVAKGQLFALSNLGRLLKVNNDTAMVTQVGSPVKLPPGQTFGLNFNPTVDRIRLVTDEGHNLRLHPDTGAQVDGDANTPGVQPDTSLAYGPGDLLSGNKPRIVAVAYTYNKVNEKITTNYAIDAGLGYLVVQGSIEGAPTVVSPNTGRLQAIGPLLIDRFDTASLDISDVNNAAYLVTNRKAGGESKLYEVNLGSGQARLIGAIGSTEPVRGMAIVP